MGETVSAYGRECAGTDPSDTALHFHADKADKNWPKYTAPMNGIYIKSVAHP